MNEFGSTLATDSCSCDNADLAPQTKKFDSQGFGLSALLGTADILSANRIVAAQ